jgi:hypothetical protein
MDKTARDLVLELFKEDHITKEETDLLLDAINQKGGTNFIPVPYREINPTPDWTYDPYRPGQTWYTTTSENLEKTKTEE